MTDLTRTADCNKHDQINPNQDGQGIGLDLAVLKPTDHTAANPCKLGKEVQDPIDDVFIEPGCEIGNHLERPCHENQVEIVPVPLVVTKAKKSISNFKLREGSPIGVRVTLRRQRMFEFFECEK